MTITRRQALQIGAAAAAAPAFAHLEGMHLLAAETPTMLRAEAQVWWRKAGLVIPSLVGEHIHLFRDVPDTRLTYSGVVTFNTDVITHGLSGTEGINWVRLSDQNGIKQTITVPKGTLLGDSGPTRFTFDVNLDSWTAGWHELRWSANCAVNGEGNRTYQSTGDQIAVKARTPTYRTLPWNESRGWYSAHFYQNFRWTTDRWDIRPGATVRFRAGPGTGGLATKLTVIALAPNYHAGDPGTELLRVAGPKSGSIVIPADAQPGTKLVGLASDGQLAGIDAAVIQP